MPKFIVNVKGVAYIEANSHEEAIEILALDEFSDVTYNTQEVEKFPYEV